jgi:hypothetical protein
MQINPVANPFLGPVKIEINAYFLFIGPIAVGFSQLKK